MKRQLKASFVYFILAVIMTIALVLSAHYAYQAIRVPCTSVMCPIEFQR